MFILQDVVYVENGVYTYGCYNNIITSPKYKANNKIKELIVCG